MTSPTHGGDVERLRSTARQICEAAEQLIATDIRVTAALSTLTWNGPDAMRARQVWDTEHGPALLATARALVDAGQHLVAEADEQDGVSAAGTVGASRTAPTAPTPTAEGGAGGGATLAQTFTALSALLTSPGPGAALARAAMAHVPESVRAAISDANLVIDGHTLTNKVPLPGSITGPVAAAGAISDLDTFNAALRNGDVDNALRSGGSLIGSAVGLGSPAHGAAIGFTWESVYRARDRWFTGSRFEENFVARNDAIADMIGPWAVPVGLGTFIVTGVETGIQSGWEKLTDVIPSRNPENPEWSQGGVDGR